MNPLFSGIPSKSVFYKVLLMITKPQNLLRSLLLIPYFAWAIGLLFVYLVSVSTGNSYTQNAFFDALTGVAAIYTIGIVIWGIPYTLLTLGLWLWSNNKPAPTIFKVFVFSPFLLSILSVVEVGLITFWPPEVSSLEVLTDFPSYLLITVIPTLVFGYAFVGMSSILYKSMRQLNLIIIEEEAI